MGSKESQTKICSQVSDVDVHRNFCANLYIHVYFIWCSLSLGGLASRVENDAVDALVAKV